MSYKTNNNPSTAFDLLKELANAPLRYYVGTADEDCLPDKNSGVHIYFDVQPADEEEGLPEHVNVLADSALHNYLLFTIFKSDVISLRLDEDGLMVLTRTTAHENTLEGACPDDPNTPEPAEFYFQAYFGTQATKENSDLLARIDSQQQTNDIASNEIPYCK